MSRARMIYGCCVYTLGFLGIVGIMIASSVNSAPEPDRCVGMKNHDAGGLCPICHNTGVDSRTKFPNQKECQNCNIKEVFAGRQAGIEVPLVVKDAYPFGIPGLGKLEAEKTCFVSHSGCR